MKNLTLKCKIKRLTRTRSKIKKTHNLPRLIVYRSNKYIYAQIVDKKGKVLISGSEKEINDGENKLTKSVRADKVGELIAQKASKIKIEKVVFDRGSYKYHGRVKALAEAARKGGLKF